MIYIVLVYARIIEKCMKTPTGKAFIYSNISLKLLESWFFDAFTISDLWNKSEYGISTLQLYTILI